MDESSWTPAVRPGAWAAVDVGLLRHRKFAALKGRADVLYLACVLHCADELTDGRVRQHAARRLLLEARARRADWAELVAAGLLVDADDGDGWTVPDYLEWNPPRSYWDGKRAQSAQRQARWREARRAGKGPANGHGSTGGNALRGGGSNALRNAREGKSEKERTSRPLAARGRACPECGDIMAPGVSMEDHRRLRHGVQPVDPGEAPEAPRPAFTQRIPPGGSRTPEALRQLLRDA